LTEGCRLLGAVVDDGTSRSLLTTTARATGETILRY